MKLVFVCSALFRKGKVYYAYGGILAKILKSFLRSENAGKCRFIIRYFAKI